jgi:integrase
VTSDPKALTVREAFWRCSDMSDLGPNAIANRDTLLKMWERFSIDPPVAAVTELTIEEFRQKARAEGYSGHSIRVAEVVVRHVVRKFRPFDRKCGRRASAPEPLSFREAVERHYFMGSPDISVRTVRKLRHNCTAWEKRTANQPITEITDDTFRGFRERGLSAGLSPVTIEMQVSDVLTVLRFCLDKGLLAALPRPGKRLRRHVQLKETPSLGDLSRAYANCGEAEWPHGERWRRVRENGSGRFVWSGAGAKHAKLWWRCVFCALYFTALRRSDLLSLEWGEIEKDRIVRKMQKTGFSVTLPIHPVLREHLDSLPRTSPYVFGRNGSQKQIREQMRRITMAGGGRPFTCQSVRRLAAQCWERSRAGSGRLILGHAFGGAARFYLNPFEALTSAIPTLEVPAGMGKAPERPQTDGSLLDSLRRLDRGEVAKLLAQLLEGVSA